MHRVIAAVVFATGIIASTLVAKADICAPLRNYPKAAGIARFMSEGLRHPRYRSASAQELLDALKAIISKSTETVHFEPYRDKAFLTAVENLSVDQALECFPEYQKALDAASEEKVAEDRQRQHQLALERAKQDAQQPSNALPIAYARYIFLKRCYEERIGYAMVYLNEIEFERARWAIKMIENLLVDREPELDKDAAWKRAVDPDGPQIILRPNFDNCHREMLAIAKTWQGLDPDSTAPKKDF
jgi:hypothetical protein